MGRCVRMNVNRKKIKNDLMESVLGINALGKLYAKRRTKKVLEPFLPAAVVLEAEKSRETRARAVEAYFAKWPNRFKADQKLADRLLATAPAYKDRTDKDAVRAEMLFCRIAYGFHPDEYICYELEGRTLEDVKSFISSKDNIQNGYRMNKVSGIAVFNNKGLTYQRFQKYYQRDAVFIENKSDYAKYRDFVEKHPVFVKKNVYEAMGRSVELIDLTGGMNGKELFDKWIGIGPHLLEERVEQCEVLARLHPASVNTIRCITFNTRHGIQDPYYFMKIGQGGSFIDNGGAGGILVGIDRETGRLNTDGFDELDKRYVSHPDSGVLFRGYQLPEWEELKKLCLELSAQIPEVKFIGWDLTHTERGWVIIEGNGMSQMIGPQTIWKCGCKADVAAWMADMDLVF